MKYKLTNETMIHNKITLHRIECVEAFGDVKIGDKGGWIEKESNLSQENNAWVYDNARVSGNAKVFGNAKVCGNAKISGMDRVYGNADCGNAKVFDKAEVYGNADVFCNAQVYGDAKVHGNAAVRDDAKVCGTANVRGDVEVVGDAKITSTKDYMVIKNCWSSGRYFTWTRSNNMWKVRCFYGTGEELIKNAYAESQQKGDCYKATVDYVENIVKLTNIMSNFSM